MSGKNPERAQPVPTCVYTEESEESALAAAADLDIPDPDRELAIATLANPGREVPEGHGAPRE